MSIFIPGGEGEFGGVWSSPFACFLIFYHPLAGQPVEEGPGKSRDELAPFFGGRNPFSYSEVKMAVLRGEGGANGFGLELTRSRFGLLCELRRRGGR